MNNLNKKLLSVFVTPLLALGGVVGVGTVTAASANTLNPPASVEPITVAPVNAATGEVLISWNSVPGAEFYDHSVFSAADDDFIAGGTDRATSVEFQGEIGQSYYAIVEYGDETGERQRFQSEDFRVIVRPGAVPNLLLQAEDNIISVSWDVDNVSSGGDDVANLSYAVDLYDFQTETLVNSVDRWPVTNVQFYVESAGTYVVIVSPTNTLGGTLEGTSQTVELVTSGSVPETPVFNFAEANGTDGFISWSLVSGATGYSVSVINDADGTVLAAADLGANVDNFTATDLPSGAEVLFFLTATNEVGESNPAARFLQVGREVAPLAPTNVVAVFDSAGVSVTWDAPELNDGPEITGYIVSLVDLTSDRDFLSYPTTEQEYLFEGVTAQFTPGHVYQVSVSATNRAGVSVSGDSNVFTAPPGAPSEAQDLTVALLAPTTAQVSWVAPFSTGGSPVTKYTVSYGDANNNGGSFDVLPSVRSYTVSDLAPDTEYAFVVSVSNAFGETFGTTVLVTSGPGTVPATPSVADLDSFVPGPNPVVEFLAPVDGVISTIVDRPAGSWVYAYVFSDPIALGWQQVGPGGVVSWDYSSLNLSSGVHRLVILDRDGVILGLSAFTVEVAASDGGNTGGTGSNAGSNTGGTATTNLPVTGSDLSVTTTALYGSVIALALGIMLVVGASITNRRKLVPVKTVS